MQNQRYLFIDIFRFIAILFMVEGHIVEALLHPSLKQTFVFTIHDFFHGFTAPVFLFTSGAAFGFSTLRKWEEHRTLNKKVLRRIVRYCGILLFGYALHLPYFSFSKSITESSPQEIAAFFQVDVLHCIAITLLIAQLLILFIPTKKIYNSFIGIFIILIVFFAPFLWSISLKNFFPLWFSSYLNAENSWFPLFPYAVYIFSGFFFAWIFLKTEKKEIFTVYTLIFGILAILIAIIFLYLPVTFYPPHDIWKANPSIFFLRIGGISIILFSLLYFLPKIKISLHIPSIIGKESLFIYILHLILIYGTVVNKGVKIYYGQNFSWSECTGIFFLFFAIIAVCAYVWNYLKQQNKKISLALQWGGIMIFLFYFFTRSY